MENLEPVQKMELGTRNSNEHSQKTAYKQEDGCDETISDKSKYEREITRFEDPCCDCFSRLQLKVEQELDRLRGEFRTKEQQLVNPLLNKFQRLEILLTTLRTDFEV